MFRIYGSPGRIKRGVSFHIYTEKKRVRTEKIIKFSRGVKTAIFRISWFTWIKRTRQATIGKKYKREAKV